MKKSYHLLLFFTQWDTNEIVIRVDKRYFRPTEVNQLLGDSSKAFKKLNWAPKISLEELIEEMIAVDNEEALKEIHLRKNKFMPIKKDISLSNKNSLDSK